MRDLQVQSKGLKQISRIEGVTRALATAQGCRCAILNLEARLSLETSPMSSLFTLHSSTLRIYSVRRETDSVSQVSTGKPAVIFFEKG